MHSGLPSGTVGTLRLKGAEVASRQHQVRRLFGSLELRPAGMAPQQILVVRVLDERHVGTVSSKSGGWLPSQSWQARVRAAVQTQFYGASRPFVERVPASANAVLFDNAAQLLYCYLAGLKGATWGQWWWRQLVPRVEFDWKEVALRWLRSVPRAFSLLAQRRQLRAVLGLLSESSARTLSEALRREWTLPALRRARAEEAPATLTPANASKESPPIAPNTRSTAGTSHPRGARSQRADNPLLGLTPGASELLDTALQCLDPAIARSEEARGKEHGLGSDHPAGSRATRAQSTTQATCVGLTAGELPGSRSTRAQSTTQVAGASARESPAPPTPTGGAAHARQSATGWNTRPQSESANTAPTAARQTPVAGGSAEGERLLPALPVDSQGEARRKKREAHLTRIAARRPLEDVDPSKAEVDSGRRKSGGEMDAPPSRGGAPEELPREARSVGPPQRSEFDVQRSGMGERRTGSEAATSRGGHSGPASVTAANALTSGEPVTAASGDHDERLASLYASKARFLAEWSFSTKIGGAFYLLELFQRLDIPRCFEDDWKLETEVGHWGSLELALRGLGLGAAPADPLMPALGRLAGRDDGEPAGSGVVAPARPSLPSPGTSELSPEAQRSVKAWRAKLRPLEAAPGAFAWQSLAVPWLVGKLHQAVSPRSGFDLAGFLAVGAKVFVSTSHVDVVFPSDAANVAVRRAGLDRDPGWSPELGRVIAFHFE